MLESPRFAHEVGETFPSRDGDEADTNQVIVSACPTLATKSVLNSSTHLHQILLGQPLVPCAES